MHYVYILECRDHSLYTGYTTDLDRRLRQHNDGKASKYTRGRLPAKIVYFEKFSSKGEALSREYAIKQLDRDKKLKLIKNNY